MLKSKENISGSIRRNFIGRMIPMRKCTGIVWPGRIVVLAFVLLLMTVPALATEGGQSGDNDNLGNQSGVESYIVTVQYISEISLAHDVFGAASATLPFGTHYLCYSPAAGQINFVFGRSITLEGGEFYSEDCTLQSLTFDSDGEHILDYTMATSHPIAFSYSPGQRLVFSDLGDYPALYFRKEGDYQYAECVIAAVASILLLYRGIVGAFYGRRTG